MCIESGQTIETGEADEMLALSPPLMNNANFKRPTVTPSPDFVSQRKSALVERALLILAVFSLNASMMRPYLRPCYFASRYTPAVIPHATLTFLRATARSYSANNVFLTTGE
jgi:hypothetical protein